MNDETTTSTGDTATYCPEYDARSIGTMKIEEREYLGLWQFREKGYTPWRLYVNSFGGDGKTAYCREWGGGLRPVPITRKGYLVVGGRRIGPRRWDH